MYPQQSNAASAGGGDFWWQEGAPAVIRATQWDALVTAFQTSAARLLPAVYGFASNGDCSAIVSRLSNARRTSSLRADGVYGPATADALGALLCAAGWGDRSTRLANEIRARTISRETLRELIFFGLHVHEVGNTSAPFVTSDIEASSVLVPDAVVLPTWDTRVQSDVRDRTWFGAFPVGAAPVPAPSVAALINAVANGTLTGGTTTPPPPSGPLPSTTPPPVPAPIVRTTQEPAIQPPATPWYRKTAGKVGIVGGAVLLSASLVYAATRKKKRK